MEAINTVRQWTLTQTPKQIHEKILKVVHPLNIYTALVLSE